MSWQGREPFVLNLGRVPILWRNHSVGSARPAAVQTRSTKDLVNCNIRASQLLMLEFAGSILIEYPVRFICVIPLLEEGRGKKDSAHHNFYPVVCRFCNRESLVADTSTCLGAHTGVRETFCCARNLSRANIIPLEAGERYTFRDPLWPWGSWFLVSQ